MKRIIWTAAFLACTLFLSAESPFTLLTQPSVLVPLGPEADGTKFYDVGGDLLVEGELNFDSLRLLHFGPQIDFGFLPIREGTTSLTMINFGANAGVKVNPLARTIYRLWAGGGASYAMYEQESSLFPYFTVGTDVNFRLTPAVNLIAGGRYVHGQSSAGTVYQTFGISLGFGYSFQSASRGAELHYDTRTREIYPLYYTWYDENPLGEITIRNRIQRENPECSNQFLCPPVYGSAQVLGRRHSCYDQGR